MNWSYINDKWTSNIKNDNFGKWIHSSTNTYVPPPPTDEQMIKAIHDNQNLEDKDFFREMVDWLRKYAPRKLRVALQELWSAASASVDLSYERLCEVVYKMAFRASEALEHRMVLGPNNQWVQKYFGDFPPGSR